MRAYPVSTSRIANRRLALVSGAALCALPFLPLGCANAPEGSDQQSSADSNTDSSTSGCGTDKREIFVDPGNVGGNTFRTIQDAVDSVKGAAACVTVTVKAGSYKNTGPAGSFVKLIGSGAGGAPNRFFTLRAAPGANVQLTSDTYNAIGISGGAAYIRIVGFTVIGTAATGDPTTKLTQCGWKNGNTGSASASDRYQGNPERETLCAANGITIKGDGSGVPHDITIENNEVKDFPGGGIGVDSADLITIKGNTVHGNNLYNSYGSSGIGIITPKLVNSLPLSDDYRSYRLKIINNKSYANKNQLPWINKGKLVLTDGNGIICDTFGIDPSLANIPGASSSKNGPYAGKTLIANNVVYDNGGKGINAFASMNIDILNNTAYANDQNITNDQGLPSYPDISAVYVHNVNVMNNILYGDKGILPDQRQSQNSAVKYDYNVYAGSLVAKVKAMTDSARKAALGDNYFTDNPSFVNAAGGDFHLSSSYAATCKGISNATSNYLAAPETGKDKDGVARAANCVDIGAFQYKSGSSVGDLLPSGVGGDLFEAELGAIGGYSGGVSSARTGYTGTGFFDFHESTTANLTLTVPRATAGTFALTVRYSNGASIDRPLRILVNGAEVEAALSFPPTANWVEWKTVSFDAALNAGENLVRFEAGPSSGPNLDSVQVTPR